MKRYLVILLLLITGCAPWVKVGGLYKSPPHNFSVELPNGWMRLNTGDRLYITRDGVLLQNIIQKSTTRGLSPLTPHIQRPIRG